MSIVGGIFVVYLFLGLIYLGLLITVLHTHQTRTKKIPPILFWEFRKELRQEFPDATRWARAIFILGVALIPVWFIYW